MIALAALAQGCQQPEQELGGNPQAPVQQGHQAMPEPEYAAEAATRLSFWGVGQPGGGAVGGAAARLEGVLSRLGGCLVVTADNGSRVQPVFPAGKARWNEAARTLSFAGRDYRPGDRIVLGGGGVGAPSAYAREAGVAIAPCLESDLWVVIA